MLQIIQMNHKRVVVFNMTRFEQLFYIHVILYKEQLSELQFTLIRLKQRR